MLSGMSTSPRLAGKRLYIADLARRLALFEQARVPMHAPAFRLLAKRLRTALAGEACPKVRRGGAEWAAALQPTVDEAIDARWFDEHGQFPGAAGRNAQRVAERLMGRLRRSTAAR